MSNYNFIKYLSEISNNYDAFIIDVWGVLWDGIEPYQYSKHTLEKLKELNKNIILLSNAPRRSHVVIEKLASIGITSNLYDTIISSGEVCRENCLRDKESLSLLGHNYYFIGQETDKGIALNLEIEETSSIHKSSFILVCGTRDFSHTLDNYINELDEGLKLQLPLVCANPDKVVIRKNDQLLICAGILADYYESNGGVVFRYGKPFSQVYKKCVNFFKNINSKITSEKVLVIGDSLETDILGANNNNFSSLLITNGIHKKQLYITENQGFSKNSLDEICIQYSAYPNYIMEKFIY
ncbi:MAG: TIGR01459 family HAD-type hydrolase [Rickettsiales bacterium]|nr:TIGR01459 family HAD-type hydrolase [Rickettsiales bacterium]OUV79111.1 MAG: hypothetical protein CBC91_03970 [Rickettsiales bacterium TMED131]